MVTIKVTNMNSQTLGLDWNTQRLIDSQLSYQVPGVEFIPSVVNGFWDGVIHLYNTRNGTFSTGLLPKVEAILNQNNIQYIIQDIRIKPINGTPIPTNTTLRPDQEDVVKVCMEKGRGIISLPTSWGKSFSQIELVCRLNLPTVIVVHKLDIMQQFINWFKKRAGIEVGQVGNGIINPQHITVAMIQTLANAFKVKSKDFKSENVSTSDYQKIYKMCSDAQVLITDEMHCMTDGDVWAKVFNRFTNAYYRLGFSATPYKCFAGELQSEAIYGPIIAEDSYTDCINKGYIATPEVIVYRYKQYGLPYGMKYQQAYKERIVENEDRNFNICKIALDYWKQNKKVFIAVTHLNHGRLLKKMLDDVIGKENVIFAEGSTSLQKRQEGIEDFENGGKILIASSIYNEGVNISSMDVLINARCSLSQSMFLQTIGRVLRLAPGKQKGTIIDIQDQNIKYFGLHGRTRLDMLEACGFDIIFKDI